MDKKAKSLMIWGFVTGLLGYLLVYQNFVWLPKVIFWGGLAIFVIGLLKHFKVLKF